LRDKSLVEGALAGFRDADVVVFPSTYVRDEVIKAVGTKPGKNCFIMPQGLYKVIDASTDAATAFRAQLGMGCGDKLILGIGYADLRKGFDLFLQLWRQMNRRGSKQVHFAWIGSIDPTLESWLAGDLGAASGKGSFHVIGYLRDVTPALSAANAFALTSREDPFPTVVLEALSVGIPVVAFEHSGGIPEMLEVHKVGKVVGHADVVAMAAALKVLLHEKDPAVRATSRRALIAEHFAFRPYVRRLAGMVFPHLHLVSVAVPNFNYARYMPDRLGTVFSQTYPVTEVLVLDDMSSDDSLEVIPKIADEWARDITLLRNAANSGSVFAQWRKAAETTTGEWLWIAEADDISDPSFLDRILAATDGDPSVVLAFSDSRAITGDGLPLSESYKPYYATVEPNALTRNEIFTGPEFIGRFLSVKNLIVNVSAVLWRREALLRALDGCSNDLKNYRMAGDWRLYLQALSVQGARIAYEARPLNVHRRHPQSVTHELNGQRHLDEIVRCHDFARQVGARPATFAARQTAYLDEVAEQLNVKPNGFAPRTHQSSNKSLRPGRRLSRP
jgi:hypothetical protein